MEEFTAKANATTDILALRSQLALEEAKVKALKTAIAASAAALLATEAEASQAVASA